eukprot:12214.XXX_830814_831032_1 [CDS] Oithona nana genome sequencing.
MSYSVLYCKIVSTTNTLRFLQASMYPVIQLSSVAFKSIPTFLELSIRDSTFKCSPSSQACINPVWPLLSNAL